MVGAEVGVLSPTGWAGTFVVVVLATSAVGIVGNWVSTIATRVGDDMQESALETSTNHQRSCWPPTSVARTLSRSPRSWVDAGIASWSGCWLTP